MVNLRCFFLSFGGFFYFYSLRWKTIRPLSPVHFEKLYLITLFYKNNILGKNFNFPFLSKCDACQGYGTFIRSSWRSIFSIIWLLLFFLLFLKVATSAKINDRSQLFGRMNYSFGRIRGSSAKVN